VNAIEVRGLRKTYRKRLRDKTTALDGVEFDVPSGGVFGFLGPNGSGKTTTIRCLLGLIRAEAGTCTVLGSPSPSGLRAVIGRVGSIVETPALFPGFSGRRNLEIFAELGGVPGQRVDDVLARVGLADRADDRVKAYSLGMKQRLGVAAALLKDPELLVLDEPANGLDPAGLREVRLLLRALADEGRTVFLSSHLLSEVQQICDSVAILSRGKCIAQGPVGEVLAGSSAGGYVVRSPNLRRAKKILADAGFIISDGDRSLLVAGGPKEASRITRTLADAGIYLSELRPEQISLESVFLELTGGNGDQ
jgi:ABC-2 type transport system ATP-binding protein